MKVSIGLKIVKEGDKYFAVATREGAGDLAIACISSVAYEASVDVADRWVKLMAEAVGCMLGDAVEILGGKVGSVVITSSNSLN